MNLIARLEEELNSCQFQMDSCLPCPHGMNEQHQTLASPSSKTYWSKNPKTRRGIGGPPPTFQFFRRQNPNKSILKYYLHCVTMQQVIFVSVFHARSHEHTEWLLTPLAVPVTEETQGFLSHH